MIDALGSKLEIEPAFFRKCIFNYAWYNIRDRWIDPPNLDIVTKQQKWLTSISRLQDTLKITQTFTKAIKEAEKFNILKRPQDDLNNLLKWDDEKAIVGITRTRASFWLRKAEVTDTAKKEAIAVVLVDPTIQ
ncbi:hypothetical protein B0O99DRAFT_684132 [Bisporella sp. PMI_857]|nr:hypothetical protein B0O99DRAFT_684132 [Bisporella sp. PMI_857]